MSALQKLTIVFLVANIGLIGTNCVTLYNLRKVKTPETPRAGCSGLTLGEGWGNVYVKGNSGPRKIKEGDLLKASSISSEIDGLYSFSARMNTDPKEGAERKYYLLVSYYEQGVEEVSTGLWYRKENHKEISFSSTLEEAQSLVNREINKKEMELKDMGIVLDKERK